MTQPVGDFAMDTTPAAENPGAKPMRLAQQSAMTRDLPSTRSSRLLVGDDLRSF